MVYGLLLPLLGIGIEKASLRPLKVFFAFTPLVAVVAVSYVIGGEQEVRRLFSKFKWKGFSHKWFFLSTWTFSIIGIVAIILRFFYDGFFPPFKDFGPVQEILLYSLPLFLFPGITEEFGWRGFLQSRLQKRIRTTYACVIVGLVWGFWHYPDFILGNWNTSYSSQFGFFIFTIGASIIIGWLFRQTGESVFIAMLAHFGANIVFTFSPIFKIYEDGSSMTIRLYIGMVWGAVLVIVGMFGLDLKRKKITEPASLGSL